MVLIMQNVYVMMGLPGSGKTTWADEAAESTDSIIIGRDDIRYMLRHSYIHDASQKRQKFVWDVSNYMIQQSLQRDFDITLDQMSLTRKQRINTVKMIRGYAPKAIITLVYCAEENNNVERRMNSNMKWGNRQYYVDLIENLKGQIEKPNYIKEGFDKYIFVPGKTMLQVIQSKIRVCRFDNERIGM